MKSLTMVPRVTLAAWAVILATTAQAQAPSATPPTPLKPSTSKPTADKPTPPKPTHADVAYGDHARQRMDVFLAPSDRPTPVIFFVHGGGWTSGDKSSLARMVNVPKALEAGVSVVAINYRLVPQAVAAGVHPPVKWPLTDAARALQFVRSQAEAWNLDPTRIGASGGSAGACTSLWLAMHDDLADSASEDPIARQSTRLTCAAVVGAQTSLDPRVLRAWIPNMQYGGHAFGFRPDPGNRESGFHKFHEARDEVWPLIQAYSPIEHASADDPPIYLQYNQKDRALKGTPQADPTHSALLGQLLVERLEPLGVEVILDYPGEPDDRYASVTDFLLDRLKP